MNDFEINTHCRIIVHLNNTQARIYEETRMCNFPPPDGTKGAIHFCIQISFYKIITK